MTSVIARLEGITRRFGSVTALDGAHADFRAGEIHGVLGENGAGKSTLLTILGGGLTPDAGSIWIDDREVTLSSARDAWAHGIGLVHQHFALVPRLTVLENLALGRGSASKGWRLPLDDLRVRTRELMEETGLPVPLDAAVEELGVGERQRVEILKALLREPRVLVLDEPTAVLAPPEVERLFTLLRGLAAGGTCVVLVAHNLDEVLSVADRVTVLRHGRTVLTSDAASTTAEALAAAMVGTDAEALTAAVVGEGSTGRDTRARSARASMDSEVVASCVGVTALGTRGETALDGVSLQVHRGEIVGVAGVDGNGQRELALLFAARALASEGRVELPSGIGFIPQDRTSEGLGLDLDLAENVALLAHRQSTSSLLDWDAIRGEAERIRKEFDVRAPGAHTVARTLSGGNQQRLVVGREVAAATDLLVAENPTRGLDVASTAYVRGLLMELVDAEQAPGVLLISTDLDEVLALSDRVFAMVRGRLIEISPEERSREAVGAVMLGSSA